MLHYDTPAYNPPADVDVISWLNSQFSLLPGEIPSETNIELASIPAARIYLPGSPQAYSSEEIYVIWNGMLINIKMHDVDETLHQELYEAILSTFQFED